MAITVEARTEIIALVVGMFGAAPGASVLSDLVAAREAGMTLKGIAASVSGTAQFQSIYPTFMTNGEFATALVDNLVGTLVPDADKAAAAVEIEAMLTAGASRSDVVVDVIAVLNSVPTDHAVWGNASLAFDNKIEVANYFSVVKQQSGASLEDLQEVIASVNETAASVTAAKAVVDGTADAGEEFRLTTTIDSFTGGSGNDTFDGTQTATPAVTFSALDSIDGGLGNDTLKVVQTAALDTTALGGISVKNVENVQLTSGAAVTTNTTAWTGVTSLAVSAATDANATAAATTDVTVTAAALTGVAGAVTVNGGKDVTVVASDTSTTAAASANTILVGGTTAAAGAVKVTYTETVSDGADAGVTGSSITVTGGSTVEVNSLAVNGAGSAAADVLTLGAVTVNGKATTEVTVNQSAATATYNGTTATKVKITNGGVTITDTNATTTADTIKTVTLSNFGATTIASTVLDTLNITETGDGASGAITIDQTAADTSTAATALTVNTSGSFGLISGTQADVYKTLNVAASATTTLADIAMDALTTINVSGAGVTTFTALTAAQNAKLASIVSTGGGLTIGTELATGVAVTGGAGVETIMIGGTTKTIDLGAGNDVVTVSTTTMGAGGAVKGGEGTDTLVANTNSSAFSGLPAFTGFETLRVAGAAAQGAHNAVGFTSLEVGALAGAASFTNVAAGVGLKVLADMANDLTFTLADATGTADVVNLTISSSGATDLTGDTITLAGVETINVTSTDTNTTAHVNTIELVATSAKTLNLTGNAGVVVVNADASITSFDASGVTLSKVTNTGVTFDSTNVTVAEAVSIKGSNGIDTLTGSATAIDTIDGGAGADVLGYDGAADVFTGGAGNDTFDILATGTSTVFLTIADLTAGDKIDLSDAALTAVIADATVGAKTTFGAAATFAQALDAAAAGGANNVEWFQFENNTYLVVDASAGATFVSGTDSVIKITGLVDLSTSTIATEILTIV